MTTSRPFHDLFVLNMQKVLTSELETALGNLDPTPLTSVNLAQLRAAETTKIFKGIYILHYQDRVVYVGKADNSLRVRMEEHFAKLSARKRVNMNSIEFRCLYLDANWSALAHEETLIRHFKAGDLADWNSSGFGIHDPGRNRDSTELDEDHFDRLHPIDDAISSNISVGKYNIWKVLTEVKASLPFLLRFETTKLAKEQMMTSKINITNDLSVRGLMEIVTMALGQQWQASILFGYVILYREHKDYSGKSCQRYKRGNGQWTVL